MTIETLVSGESFQVPVKVAWEWQIVRKYFETMPEPNSVFTFPAQVEDKEIISKVIDFTKQHCEIKIAHIPGPIYQPVNLAKAPYNVPAWALEWMYDQDLAMVFSLLKVGEVLQFSALVELCAVILALLFVGTTKQERSIISGFPQGMTEEVETNVREAHKEWAMKDNDMVTSYE